MFLWMIEEYTFILSYLCVDDHDGFLVLGQELLLLACTAGAAEREGEA